MMQIRNATIDDATAIAALTIELGYDVTTPEITGRLQDLLPRSTQFIAVAEADGNVLGWIAAEHRTLLEFEPRIEIMGLVVSQACRRAGIGRALVAAAEQWQTERGVAAICVRSNVVRPESHPFYESLGFARYKTQHAYIKRNRAATGAGSPTQE